MRAGNVVEEKKKKHHKEQREQKELKEQKEINEKKNNSIQNGKEEVKQYLHMRWLCA